MSDKTKLYHDLLEIIQSNILTIPKVNEVKEVVVTTAVDDINDSKILYVYPYMEPTPPEPSEVELLQDQVLQLQEYIVQQEMEKLLKEGGM